MAASTGRAEAVRRWLREHPGWHFTADVLDAMGLTGWKSRQPYAFALRSSSENGLLERSGHGKAIRYRYGREPIR